MQSGGKFGVKTIRQTKSVKKKYLDKKIVEKQRLYNFVFADKNPVFLVEKIRQNVTGLYYLAV